MLKYKEYIAAMCCSGGGVRKPPDKDELLQWLKGSLADGTINDKLDIVSESATVTGRNAVYLNGTDAYIQGSSSQDITNKTIFGWVSLPDAADGTIWSFGASGGRFRTIGGIFIIGGTTNTGVSSAPYVGSWNFYELDTNADGDVIDFRINGTPTGFTGPSNFGQSSGIYSLGAADSGGITLFKEIYICGFGITGGLQIPMEEGRGTLCYDVSGLENHGTIYNGAQVKAIDYGRSDGTGARVDTGIEWTDDLVIDVVCRPQGYSTTQAVLGVFNAGDLRGLITFTSTGFLQGAFIGALGDASSTTPVGTYLNINYSADGGMVVDGNQVIAPQTPTASTIGANVFLFGRNRADSGLDSDLFFNGDIASVKLRQGGVKVADMVALADGSYYCRIRNQVLPVVNGTIAVTQQDALPSWNLNEGFVWGNQFPEGNMESSFTVTTPNLADISFVEEDGRSTMRLTSALTTDGWSSGYCYKAAFTPETSGAMVMSFTAKGLDGTQCCIGLYDTTAAAFVYNRGTHPLELDGTWQTLETPIEVVAGHTYRIDWAVYNSDTVVYFDTTMALDPDISIPALADGTYAANGDIITFSGCKNGNGVHNKADVSIINRASEILAYDNLYAIGGNAIPINYSMFKNHGNGNLFTWLKFAQDPSCKVKEAGLYNALYDPDDATIAKLKKYWAVGDCGTESTLGFIQLVDDLGDVLVDDAGNELGYYV